MGLDQIYTPCDLADKLVKSAQVKRPRLIADFAAGDGALLKAAHKVFPRAKIVGGDIDPLSRARVVEISNSSDFRECDFLNFDEVNQTFSGHKRFDLILLNPPFSNKGGQKFNARLHDQAYRCSIPFVFVLHSLNFLSLKGELLAILPSSMLTNESDRTLRENLAQGYEIQILDIIDRAFPEHDVNVCLVRIIRRKLMRSGNVRGKSSSDVKNEKKSLNQVQIMRGSISMHQTQATRAKSGIPLIHTTSIRSGEVTPNKIRNLNGRQITDTVVLIPRVGRPRLDKLVLYTPSEPTTISDCLFAIKAETKTMTSQLYDLMRDSWVQLEAQYQGSCARYITIDKLNDILANLGFEGISVSILQSELINLHNKDAVSNLSNGIKLMEPAG